MVCPRCIEAVQQVFQALNISTTDIQLGQVSLVKALPPSHKTLLQTALMDRGFELLDDKQTQLINQIKSTIIQVVHYQKEMATVNFSSILSEQLHYDYAYLSRLFSSVEGRTIEKFIIAQKIEKVKELLTYQELNLSEIAYRMNYSSAAYLSAQFKKVTGMSPSVFKELQDQDRQFLDKV